jgi:hypothetical protein
MISTILWNFGYLRSVSTYRRFNVNGSESRARLRMLMADYAARVIAGETSNRSPAAWPA